MELPRYLHVGHQKFLFGGVFSFLSAPLLIKRMELPRYLHVGHRTPSQRSFCLEECSPSCQDSCSLRGWVYLDIYMLSPYTFSEKFLFGGVFSFLSGPLLIKRMGLP
ncbi:hypothetical protein J6590_095753 [Homalodisca vitripennis]|nr:hypothetical protein J6590_095753 [Homalodisca vitripennis]